MEVTKVAVVQAASVLFDSKASLEKAEYYIQQASEQEAELVLFPEAFIGGYPRGLSFGTKVGSRSTEGRSLFRQYFEQAITPTDEISAHLAQLAKRYNVFIAMGVIEQDGGSLYCSIFYYHKSGKYVGKHRKIKPTASERYIWGEGDGSTLTTFQTSKYITGGLICWENYMPPARMAMYSKNVEIYLAPTADHRDSWFNSMQHIANEGRCFVLSANQFVSRSMYPEFLQNEIQQESEIMCRGGSMIVSPMGTIIAGPLFNEEGMLTAELNPKHLIESKMDLDVNGHYSRPDIFAFNINNMPETVVLKSS